ncbi:MAG: O-antigen ligase family protein [Flavobacteriales bacterium]
MYKKILILLATFLLLLNIPSFSLFYFSSALGSITSMALMASLLLVFSFEVKNKFPTLLYAYIVFLIIYFSISLASYSGSLFDVVTLFTKNILVLLGSYAILKNVQLKYVVYLLALGSLSVILDNFYFRFNDVIANDVVIEKRRYAGFYLNPNNAAFVAVLGYLLVLSNSMKYKFLLVLFTFVGLLTLSKYFFLSWFLINLAYLWYNKSKIFKYAFVVFFGLIALYQNMDRLNLDKNRLDLFYNIITFNSTDGYVEIESREETWAKSIQSIKNKPIIGNGFEYFKKGKYRTDNEGVHNSYLLVIGEAGILPCLFLVWISIWLLYKSVKMAKYNLTPLLLTIAFLLLLIVSHNLFDNYIFIFALSIIIYELQKSITLSNQ